MVVGTSVGMWLPATARYLKKRLHGQDKKFPSYITAENVEFAKSLVDGALELVAPTWLGSGDNSLRALFADPDRADFSIREPERIIDLGQVLAEVGDDFCGAGRITPPHDIGAIEYGAQACDVSAFIARAFGPAQ